METSLKTQDKCCAAEGLVTQWESIRALRMPQPRTFQPGELLFRSGDTPQGVFMLREGSAELCVQLHDKEKRLRIVSAPSLLGIVPAVTGDVHPLQARAISECKTEWLPAGVLNEALEEDPKHWEFVLHVLSHDLEEAKNSFQTVHD